MSESSTGKGGPGWRWHRQSRVLLLGGATASGKSAIAIHLARHWQAEIVSMDSMQIYRGMDIGTAKPSLEERTAIPHHLIDIAEPAEIFGAAQFLRLAEAVVQDIVERGRMAILCGGTGLYFKAWLEGLGVAPAPDPRLREELARWSLEKLWQEIELRDPATAAVIDRQNRRRLQRAMEVLLLSGQPLARQRAAWAERWDGPAVICLRREPEDLRQRINRRVEQMFERGLVEETRGLLRQGLSAEATSMQAIGYRQVREFLERGGTVQETLRQVQQRTRQYAKKQHTWFRHQLPVAWLPVPPGEREEELAGQVERIWRGIEAGQAGESICI